MTLIRSRHPDLLTQVRPLTVARLSSARPELAAAAPEPDSEAETLRAEIERLNEALLAAAIEREAAPAREQAAYDRGREAGRAEGLKSATDREQERQDMLADALEKADETTREQWSNFDRLACEVAMAALDKVLGEPANIAAVTRQIIHDQLSRLANERVLRIEVSEADFADDAALAALGPPAGIALIRNAGLPSGACRFQLSLGAIEVGPAQQWSALRPLLARWAEGEA